MKDRNESLELHIVLEQFVKHCSFSLGIQRIRQNTPHYDGLWVSRELQRVKEAYALVIRYGNLPFGGIHDITESIENANKDRILTAQELRQIADEIRVIEQIQKYFKASEIATPYIQELIDSFSEQKTCASEIEKCISINYEVLDSASSTLRTIRKSMQDCNKETSIEVQRFIAHNANKLMDTITTMRNERTCVLVKISEKNSIDGFIHGESASGQTAYVEPRSFIVLNNKLQSLKSQENNEIERILYGLSQQVKAIGYELLGNLETLAMLDELFAKALWAKEVDGCVAQLNNHHHLYMKAARHPLIDKNQVIANTYEIIEPYHSLLITGSNTGGKTVTLKTIGLFVEMTLCGLPIAAEEAIIPMFDAIYVDIGDEQSIQESLSTFSSHISKLAYICNHANQNALVLLDELGSGTDPKEGEPLAVAVLDELRQSGAMIIATTHFSALKHYGSLNDDVLLSSVQFDMEAMRPTYHYIEGISGQSNAFEIARRYGLKESVLNAALHLKEANQSLADNEMEKLEKAVLENHELKEKLSLRLADVKKLQAQLAKEKSDFVKQKEELLHQIKEEAQKDLEIKQEEGNAILEALKALQEDSKPHEIVNLKTKLAQLQIEDIEEEETSEESFAINDYVMLKKYHYYGEIISLNKDKVCVFTNGMKMNVTSKDITHAKKQETKKVQKNYTFQNHKTISMECNVIGMRVLEALPIIDKYLDDAILAKVYSVRLIHGMGSGALRKGVHDYLKHNPRVESFHMGGQGEGGLGATVVSLKQKGK